MHLMNFAPVVTLDSGSHELQLSAHNVAFLTFLGFVFPDYNYKYFVNNENLQLVEAHAICHIYVRMLRGT